MSDDGAETRERIMDATYDALVETGYADLTMSDIAEISETSTSLLHYHYDTKEDLLVSFLERLAIRLNHDLEENAPDDPVGRIHYILQWYVVDPGEEEREAFHVALLELRVQAPRNDRYRDHVRKADRIVRDGLTEAVADGIEAGLIDAAQPGSTAALILAAADGAQTRWLMTGESAYADFVHRTLYDRVLVELFTPAGKERWHELESGEA